MMWKGDGPDKFQLHAVQKLIKKAREQENVTVVVFAHGWHHNAKEGDENIATFKEVLKRLSQSEHAYVKSLNELAPGNPVPLKPRKTIGVYLGWRGETLHGFWPHFATDWIHFATFWGRKSTAHKVGYGQATEVLCKLEKAVKEQPARADSSRGNRFVVVGHSFGGALVYSALSQILIRQHIEGSDSAYARPKPFGDLVLLINPAFEALKLEPLKSLSNSSKYDTTMIPHFIIMQSKKDVPVHHIFPFGRFFSDISESNRDSEQRKRNITGAGFYKPYIGYELKLHAGAQAATLETRNLEVSRETLSKMNAALMKKKDVILGDMDLSFIGKEGWDSENPYPIISVNGEISGGHNDIDSPRLLTFVEQLIVAQMR
jgi:hypothetical protein